MAKVKSVTLLSFVLPNKVGQLAAVTEALKSAEVNVTALRATEAGSNAEFLLGVKSAKKALKALSAVTTDIKQVEALSVELPNKPGTMLKVARKLAAAGVNIQSAWFTAFTGKSGSCALVTSDDKKAKEALNKK